MLRLPTKGHSTDAVLDTLRNLRDGDVDWEGGKVWSLVFHPGDELSSVVKEAYSLFFSENALNPTAFPSLKSMEQEVIGMTATLLGGDENIVGNFTTGGTESILMAVKTARDWARVTRPKATRPEIVLPTTAHPAFDKAGHYFGVRLVHVPPRSDGRADVRAMRKAMSKNTMFLQETFVHQPFIQTSGNLPAANERERKLHLSSLSSNTGERNTRTNQQHAETFQNVYGRF